MGWVYVLKHASDREIELAQIFTRIMIKPITPIQSKRKYRSRKSYPKPNPDLSLFLLNVLTVLPRASVLVVKSSGPMAREKSLVSTRRRLCHRKRLPEVLCVSSPELSGTCTPRCIPASSCRLPPARSRCGTGIRVWCPRRRRRIFHRSAHRLTG